ncbi:MAG TPA: histidine kinase [Acidimicrobiia bacterium]|nr:histidine kinase [Acidimicrobiia bacterium]
MSEAAAPTVAGDGAPAMRNSSRLAWTVTGIVVVASCLIAVAEILDGPSPIDDLLWPVLPPLYAILGSIIVSRSQENHIGWLLIAIGAALPFESIISLAVAQGPPARLTPGWFLVLLADQLAWMLWLFPLFLMLCTFPAGRLLSPRWRWLPMLQVVMFTTLATLLVFGTEIGPANDAWTLANPVGFIDGAFHESAAFMVPWGFGLVALVLGSVTSIVLRYRRSDDVARAQLRWMLYAVFVFGLAYAFLLSTFAADDDSLMLAVALIAGVAGIPVAIIVAVLRFHLYDIDVIISRSITYGVLAAFITGVYALVVVGIGSLLGGGDEPNLALSITAVAIVAVAFEPLRKRVQHWANVLVYGRRATPYEVLADATRRLADTSDPDEVLSEITQLVVDGTGASEVVLWLAVGEAMHPRASSPAAVLEGLASVGPGTDSLSRIPGGSVIAVRHRGDVLGALSITKPRGDSVSGADEKVLADVAAGAGALLRNLGLNAELAERAEELRLSRRRLVATHDAERHRLERDLHDGAQQQVVALKVKLGIARTLAEREGAEQVATLVTALSDTVQQAVDGMRAVAHGIYPPLLEAEGLEAALNAAQRTIPIPVEIVGSRIRRYGRHVEEGVYFAVLDIVIQAVDAGATRAIISVTGGDDSVSFRVDVDVPPRDLTAVTDRVDALDGTLTVSDDIDQPRIVGTVPRTSAVEYA